MRLGAKVLNSAPRAKVYGQLVTVPPSGMTEVCQAHVAANTVQARPQNQLLMSRAYFTCMNQQNEVSQVASAGRL